MKLTEREAFKKFCPYSFNSLETKHFCDGAACMFWHWCDESTGDTKRVGYCGGCVNP